LPDEDLITIQTKTSDLFSSEGQKVGNTVMRGALSFALHFGEDTIPKKINYLRFVVKN